MLPEGLWSACLLHPPRGDDACVEAEERPKEATCRSMKPLWAMAPPHETRRPAANERCPGQGLSHTLSQRVCRQPAPSGAQGPNAWPCVEASAKEMAGRSSHHRQASRQHWGARCEITPVVAAATRSDLARFSLHARAGLSFQPSRAPGRRSQPPDAWEYTHALHQRNALSLRSYRMTAAVLRSFRTTHC